MMILTGRLTDGKHAGKQWKICRRSPGRDCALYVENECFAIAPEIHNVLDELFLLDGQDRGSLEQFLKMKLRKEVHHEQQV